MKRILFKKFSNLKKNKLFNNKNNCKIIDGKSIANKIVNTIHQDYEFPLTWSSEFHSTSLSPD